MRRIKYLNIFFAIALSLMAWCGCTHSGDAGGEAIPRRYAYPRVAMPDTARIVYSITVPSGKAIDIALSRDAEVAVERPGWLTAHYPALGATLYLTATSHPAATLDEAVANRRQRISLNLGGAKARADRFSTAAGYTAEIVVCGEGCATPVQFIVTSPAGELLSGAFMLSGPTTPADSLRPVVSALESEAFTLLNHYADH